jgi:uncharacterized membrane protein
MNAILLAGVSFFIAGIAVAVAQLWLALFRPDVFAKIEITIGALLAVLIAIWFTRKEYRDYKDQRDNPALDD